MSKTRVAKGLTLIELALCIIIIGILAAAAVPQLFNMYDDTDAETIRAIVADTEMAINEGISRDIPLSELETPGGAANQRLDNITDMISRGYPAAVQITAAGVGIISVSISGSSGLPKTATLTIQSNGKINITGITNFTRYSIVNGDLQRN